MWKLMTLIGGSSFLFSSLAHAQDGSGDGIGKLGAALAIGIAAFGGALGQGKTASAALEGMARNPQAKLQTPMILGLALIESLVIFSLVVALTKY